MTFFRFALTYDFIGQVACRIDAIKEHWQLVNAKRKREKQSGESQNKSKRAPLTQ